MWQTDGLIGTIERQLALAVIAEESFGPEPTLAELVRDPITHSVMLADHVEHGEFDALLQRARAQCSFRLRNSCVPGSDPLRA